MSFVPSRSSFVVLLAALLAAFTVGCADGTFEPAVTAPTATVSVSGSLVATPTVTTVGTPVTIRTDAEGSGLLLDACLAGTCRNLVLTGGEATFVPDSVGEWKVSLRRTIAADVSATLATTKVVAN